MEHWIPLAAANPESYVVLLAKRAAANGSPREKAAEDRRQAEADRVHSLQARMAKRPQRTL